MCAFPPILLIIEYCYVHNALVSYYQQCVLFIWFDDIYNNFLEWVQQLAECHSIVIVLCKNNTIMFITIKSWKHQAENTNLNKCKIFS